MTGRARPGLGVARAAWGASIGLAAFCCAAAPAPRAVDRSPVVVFAAASLADAFRDAGAQFTRRSGYRVRFNFAGSQQLAAQLEQGAEADVFASADDRWMRRAERNALLAGSSAVFARNRLVVVVPRANPARIERLEQLSRPGVKLVLGAETVPVGAYGRAVLRRLARAPGFPPGYERRALANVVSEEENVKAVAAKVALGEADAGIVYRSDLTPALGRAVIPIEIPEPYNVVASYPIATVRGARHPAVAREFIAFVASAAGRKILERHGLEAAAASPLPSEQDAAPSATGSRRRSGANVAAGERDSGAAGGVSAPRSGATR